MKFKIPKLKTPKIRKITGIARYGGGKKRPPSKESVEPYLENYYKYGGR